MAKLRVMHMVGAAKPGGAEMFAVRLISALHKRGEVDVLAVVRAKSWIEKALVDAGVPVKTAPFGGMLDLRTKKLVAAMARDFGPDVVQSWMNRATKYMPQGAWAQVARLGGFYDLKYYRCKVRYLIGNTHEICQYCVANGWPGQDVAMIGNFIPAPEKGWNSVRGKVREELGLRDSDRVLMMAGRLHKVKGVDIAIRALAQLPKHFVLMLVGEGPMREELEVMAQNFKVADRVKWVGWQDSVAPYAAAADIWLAPSRHEPLGNTVLDGWAHEVPVIASRTGGLAMLLADGECGILVAKEDVIELKEAIEKLAGDEALQRRFVEGGLRVFRRDYSEDGIVAKYMAYYRQISGHIQEGGQAA